MQNAYVRTRAVMRKAREIQPTTGLAYASLEPSERDIVTNLYRFPEVIKMAAEEYDPSMIANYCYDLAKGYHKFYHDVQILRAESDAARTFRLQLSQAVANTLRTGMDLLGIDMPERM